MPRITITVPEKNAQPYRFPLENPIVTLGRSTENDVVIDSGSVSAFHAEMRRKPGGYELHDIGSTNGIKIGEDRYSVIPLRNGLSANIGDVAFDFLLSDDELSILSQERPAEAVASPALVSLTPASAAAAAPVNGQKPVPRAAVYTQQRSSEGGMAAMLMFLIFAALAFCAGLAVRYQKETGGSLPSAVQAKFFAPPPPAES
jgi:pSer/pThr/pTyr-binding forkhead associated (FHA) protein